MTTEPSPLPGGFRSGLAAFIGRTNVGKSTLLNALVGTKVSIVTPKPQTTRDAVQGIVNRPDAQIVLVDTPGFFKTHASRLVDRLHDRAKRALEGIDVVVQVADPSREPGPEDELALAVLARSAHPRILCLSKSDLARRPFAAGWRQRVAPGQEVIEVSGLTGHNLPALLDAIQRHLPVGEPLYPITQSSNATQDFQLSELIREQVYLQTEEEVPYRTRVQVDRLSERPGPDGAKLLVVKAAIVTPNDRYQRMLIGVGARKIKAVGTAARRAMEAQLGRKVFLDLDVIVDRNFDT